MNYVTPEQRVLAALQTGARTWDYLQAATNTRDDQLGLALHELLTRRQIWTVQQDDIRVYGLERDKHTCASPELRPAPQLAPARSKKGGRRAWSLKP
jgi:hypothetical protein